MFNTLTLPNTNHTIRSFNERYLSNDLHKASGGNPKHRPSNYLRHNKTKEIIAELYRCSDMSNLEPAIIVRGVQADGMPQGTWVCKELLYSYAMWISPYFHVLVACAFHHMIKKQYSLHQLLHQQCNDLSKLDMKLSDAGRLLVTGGKGLKPKIKKQIDKTLEEIQLSFIFDTEYELLSKNSGGSINDNQ